jgi:IS5 family transposase
MEEALHHMPLLAEFAAQMLKTVNAVLSSKGLLLKASTVANATLIAAPRSTMSASGKRDPEMGSARKISQWYLGVKTHIGVDAEYGLVRTVRETVAQPTTLFALSSLWMARRKRLKCKR